MNTDKILIEIYDCYGSDCKITKKVKSLVIDSIEELKSGLESIGYDWILEEVDNDYDWLDVDEKSDYGDFIKGNTSFLLIECDGDWDDPLGCQLVRYSYDEKMKELDETYKSQKDEINSLFRV